MRSLVMGVIPKAAVKQGGIASARMSRPLILHQHPSTLPYRSLQQKLFAPSDRVATMSSDDAYGSFLDQANQDTGASKGSATPHSKKLTAKAVDTEIPQALQNVKDTLTSESDEPFEPVSLKWDKKSLPDEGSSHKRRLASSQSDLPC